MSTARIDKGSEVKVLELTLHGRLVGYLAGYRSGRNVLVFAKDFAGDSNRHTLSLNTHPDYPRSEKNLSKFWVSNQRLHPILSNLLPEGSLRELITEELNVHETNEFEILTYLGEDLPGALVATPMAPEDVPHHVLTTHGEAKAVKFKNGGPNYKASLAGVQMKVSVKEKEGRYNVSGDGELGDWIIKTPFTKFQLVPFNEYTAMSMAAMVGIDIPEIKLVELNKLDNLPPIELPDEKYAFAIKRFDRNGNERIHMEDFAQILGKYPREKYRNANYQQIGRVLYQYSGDGWGDTQQFARQLLVNILLANGDAHLKNWSLIYPDKVTPRLSPAYDILSTVVYIEGEKDFALNLGKTKLWYKVNAFHFENWARKIGIPWQSIKPHLDDVMDKARTLWPSALKDLPMDEEQKEKLKEHWGKLQSDFKISS